MGLTVGSKYRLIALLFFKEKAVKSDKSTSISGKRKI